MMLPPRHDMKSTGFGKTCLPISYGRIRWRKNLENRFGEFFFSIFQQPWSSPRVYAREFILAPRRAGCKSNVRNFSLLARNFSFSSRTRTYSSPAVFEYPVFHIIGCVFRAPIVIKVVEKVYRDAAKKNFPPLTRNDVFVVL